MELAVLLKASIGSDCVYWVYSVPRPPPPRAMVTVSSELISLQ